MNIASVAFTVENLSFTLCVNDTFCIELIIERYVEDVFNWKCNSSFCHWWYRCCISFNYC
ncbi:hypothetical protein SAU060112_40543 [Staphylococcus aureus]|nr:hypothetical protein SAU060112_40543 [Staphylococcus aureus]